jgi:membrane protease YdiL (CAAX protease family)
MAENLPRRSSFSLRALGLYLVLAFGITWAVLVPALSRVPESRRMPFIVLAAFGPFLSAVITIRVTKGKRELIRWLRRIFRFRHSVLHYLSAAFFLPVGMGLLHYGLYRALGGAPDFSDAIPWPLYLAYLLPTALLTGGNEEPGWRGLALPALLERMRPVPAALVLGVIHAAWHLPLMESYDTTFGWYLFNIVPLTVIFNWLCSRSRGSVVPVMLLHAGVNVIGGFLPTPLDVLGGWGTSVALRGAVYWTIAIVLIVRTKGRLGVEALADDQVGDR